MPTNMLAPLSLRLDQTTNRFGRPLAAPQAGDEFITERPRGDQTLQWSAEMTFELLTSDFYGYENLLTDQEKATLTELRAYLESKVRPIVNGYWERAEFPLEVIKPLPKIGAYDAAVAYSKERVQFGKEIGGHQLVHDLLVKCLGNITASIGMVVRVSQMLDDGTQRDEHSTLAKAYTTSRALETVAWCRELFGGNGIVLSYDVARFFADAEAISSYEGTQEMNTLIVGRTITGKAAFV